MDHNKRIHVNTIKLLYKISQIGMYIFFYFAFIIGFVLIAGIFLKVFRLSDASSWSFLFQFMIMDLALWVLCGLSAALNSWCEKQFQKYYGHNWKFIISKQKI